MEENIIKNPFVGCTARDMNFDEVKEYWCSPFSLYHLNENELFTSKTPIVIEGVRGSGKTMLLKYLSYPIQREFLPSDILEEKIDYFEQRSFGTYFRYKNDFCNLFKRLNCSQTDKEKIFKQYFSLFVIREMVENFCDVYKNENAEQLVQVICSVLKISADSLTKVVDFINNQIDHMDEIVNTSDYDDEWKENLMPLLGNGNMVRDMVLRITCDVPEWRNILFVVLLDEYENLGDLQTTVNTLIKQVDDTCNLTYRLGMRPAGMDKNNSTYVGEEKLQVDRDYLLRKLTYEKISDYKQFAIDISKKRLASVDVFEKNGLTDICLILGKNEDFDMEAAQVAKAQKQFKLIRKCIPASEMADAMEKLSSKEKLLEMYNILLVLRGGDYKEISKVSEEYIEYRKEKKLKDVDGKVRKYSLDYGNKYRLTLLYILLAIYGEKKMYYSVNTFLYLSSGSINDFISLCRNTFKFINNEVLSDLIAGNSISPVIQTNAARDTAEDQIKKVSQSNDHGSEMYSFIDNMGSIFEQYHRDVEARYPETNQFAFIDENQIHNDKNLNSYLIDLINSGAIIKKQNRQIKSIGQPRGFVYQLNRIFAPIYQYSYRTRGGYNQMLTTQQFHEMLEGSVPPDKFIGKGREENQLSLFGDAEPEVEDEFDDI